VRYGDLYTTHRHFIRESRPYVSSESSIDYTPIQYGDVLLAASGETLEEIGKSAVNLLQSPAFCGGDVIVLRPSIDVDPLFLGYALDCPESAAQKAGMGRGFTVVHIYAGQLKNLGMAIPTRPEQIAIAAFLDRETAKIDALISEAEQAILLLQERRTALISAAVTGKIDVRGLVQQEAA
jgi:type I restriction enzyme S subunit